MLGSARRAAAAALFGFAALAGDAGAEPFRLIVTEPTAPLVPNSVMDLAVELGYFAREGVEVELVRVQHTPSAVAALQAGEGEMANISADAALLVIANGHMDLKAVVSPNKTLPFLIAGTEEIGALSDLEGRSFGIGRIGSLDHTLTVQVMAAVGIDADRVEFVAIGQPNLRAQALAARQIDATTISIGTWLTMPDRSGLAMLVQPDDFFAAAPVVNKLNVVPDTVLAARRDDVAAVVRALVKASRDLAADHDLWIEAMAKARPDVDRKTLATLARLFAGSWSVNGGLNREELEATAAWAFGGAEFAGLPPIATEDWVDFGFVAEVLEAEGVAPANDRPAF